MPNDRMSLAQARINARTCPRCGVTLAGETVRIGNANWHRSCVRQEILRLEAHYNDSRKGLTDANDQSKATKCEGPYESCGER